MSPRGSAAAAVGPLSRSFGEHDRVGSAAEISDDPVAVVVADGDLESDECRNVVGRPVVGEKLDRCRHRLYRNHRAMKRKDRHAVDPSEDRVAQRSDEVVDLIARRLPQLLSDSLLLVRREALVDVDLGLKVVVGGAFVEVDVYLKPGEYLDDRLIRDVENREAVGFELLQRSRCELTGEHDAAEGFDMAPLGEDGHNGGLHLLRLVLGVLGVAPPRRLDERCWDAPLVL